MRVMGIWSAGRGIELEDGVPPANRDSNLLDLAGAMAACNNAHDGEDGDLVGDPTETAMLATARALGADDNAATHRTAEFPFNPTLKRMSTVDRQSGRLWVNTKGAPEAVLGICDQVVASEGSVTLNADRLAEVQKAVDAYADKGQRVLAVARRPVHASASSRTEAERSLTLLGLVAMYDPPRAEVAEAVARSHEAGIRIVVITGDHPRTAVAIARRIGIARGDPTAITEDELERMSDAELDAALRGGGELIFARSTPEAKLRIADALRAQRHVVAMTGDGVNDAPALRSADIGVAMGRSGTDVAREASTMVLTDDNFATIVAAVAAGRRIYDNIRKFILYIFAHTTPEVTPFIVFALGGGAIPLPLTVMQLLAFDVGTETLPALALGREKAEPGIMRRPPRPRSQSIITRPMLVRAWLFLGLISAALGMAAFFYVLLRSGWHMGDPTGAGTPLHHAYQQATTMTFLSMVACQVGTAFAARTERASLRSIGVFSNPLLLWGVAFELVLTATLIYVPVCQGLLGTAALPAKDVLLVLPFPFIVWGADELRRWAIRRRQARPGSRHHRERSAPRLPEHRPQLGGRQLR